MPEQGLNRKLVWLPTKSLKVDRPRQKGSEGDIDALAESIERVGILQPLVVVGAKTHKLVFGRRRLLAARQARQGTVPCIIADDLVDAARCLQAQQDENTLREPLSPTEMAELADQLEPLLREQATARQKAGRKAGGHKRQGTSSPQQLRQAPRGETRKQLAAAVGTNPETLRQIGVMRDAAKSEPGLYGHLPGMMNQNSVGAAWSHYQEIQAGSLPDRAHPQPTHPMYAVPPNVRGTIMALRGMKLRIEKLLAAPEGIDAKDVAAIRQAAQDILDVLPEGK